MPARKLGFVDVGARGGAAERIAGFQGRLDIVLVEPEPSEQQRLVAESSNGTKFKVIGKALGHIDGPINFYDTQNPNCSSALPVNHDFIDRYSIAGHFGAARTSVVECARYDTLFQLGGLPEPKLIKVDTQGFEYQVLQGFGGLLQECLAIELESHFYPLYDGQKVFGEIVDLLSYYGFMLRRISNPRSPDLDGDRHFDGDLVEIDAVFTKGQRWAAARPEHERLELAFACHVMGVQVYK